MSGLQFNKQTIWIWVLSPGPYSRTLSSPKTGNSDRNLQDSSSSKELGQEKLEMLSEEKYLLG